MVKRKSSSKPKLAAVATAQESDIEFQEDMHRTNTGEHVNGALAVIPKASALDLALLAQARVHHLLRVMEDVATGDAVDEYSVRNLANYLRAESCRLVGPLDEAQRELDLAKMHIALSAMELRLQRDVFVLTGTGAWAEVVEKHRVLDDYLARYLSGSSLAPLGRACHLWGGERVDHLLLIHRWGAGDFFQWGRYVKATRERCERITLACAPELHSIALRVMKVDKVIATTFDAFSRDFERTWTGACSRISILLGDTVGQQYGSPMKVEPIAGSVPDLGPGLHVGLCWVASDTAHGKTRSVRLSELEPLRSLPGAHFHSLQVGREGGQSGQWVQWRALRSWDDTTSLLAALDVVVSVDTGVAHLAANVGKPVHLLLCPFEDPRWGTDDRTPWYSTMRLYRGDLGEALKAISASLANRSRVIHAS